MTNEAGGRGQSDEDIARDRKRVWGNLSDEEYVVAWSRRLLEILPIAEPQDQWQAQLQSARRAAAAKIESFDKEKPLEVEPEDERNIIELLEAVPDIETHVRMVGGALSEHAAALGRSHSWLPPATGVRLEQTAADLDYVTRGRISAPLFIGILGLPLGCAFVAAFIALMVVFGGALTLIGLQKAPLAGQIALVAALIGAAAVVVVVYRKVIVRLPWLRRLVNR